MPNKRRPQKSRRSAASKAKPRLSAGEPTKLVTLGGVDAALARTAGPTRAPAHPTPPDAGADSSAFAIQNGGLPGMREPMTVQEVLLTRRLYWHNVIREMLNSLSVMCQTQPEIFDGRFAVLTNKGERIAIETIFPLFACSLPNTPWEKETSIAVQCTIYRIVTPDGEVFTLPLHEIRGLHSLTAELVEQLQREAESQSTSPSGEESSARRPFGLAAFTSMPKVPQHPFGPLGPEGMDA